MPTLTNFAGPDAYVRGKRLALAEIFGAKRLRKAALEKERAGLRISRGVGPPAKQPVKLSSDDVVLKIGVITEKSIPLKFQITHSLEDKFNPVLFY